jgi:phosphoadenosine phosphosulfate reductase
MSIVAELPVLPSPLPESPVLDLAPLNARFESADPSAVVEWAADHFGPDHMVMSSSFGADSAVLLHMATRVVPRIKVIFVDTGYLFPETHAFMAQLRQRLDLNVWTYRTPNDPIAWLHKAGEENPAWRSDVDRCCGANKNEPFDRALRELRPGAWLRGIRRNQAESRRDRQFVEWSPRHGTHAVSPLLNLDRRAIHAYLKQHDLPYHPLFELGYASIGCNPQSCTRAVGADEDARAGRWAGSGKVECGINVDSNSLDSAKI